MSNYPKTNQINQTLSVEDSVSENRLKCDGPSKSAEGVVYLICSLQFFFLVVAQIPIFWALLAFLLIPFVLVATFLTHHLSSQYFIFMGIYNVFHVIFFSYVFLILRDGPIDDLVILLIFTPVVTYILNLYKMDIPINTNKKKIMLLKYNINQSFYNYEHKHNGILNFILFCIYLYIAYTIFFNWD